MTAKTLKPSAGNVSKVLSAAGFTKSTTSASRIRGWQNVYPGFCCEKAGDACQVRYRTDDMTFTEVRRIGWLESYRKALEPHFAVELGSGQFGGPCLHISAKVSQ